MIVRKTWVCIVQADVCDTAYVDMVVWNHAMRLWVVCLNVPCHEITYTTYIDQNLLPRWS